MRKDKIMLDKKQLNEIEEFMTKNDIQEYSHHQNKLDISIKYPKKNASKISPKIIMGFIVSSGLIIIYPTIMNDFNNFQLWINAITILLCYSAYKIIEMIYLTFIKKDKLITVYNETKKTKEYFDSTKTEKN